MHYRKHFDTHRLQVKFLKACRQLKYLRLASGKTSFAKIQSLIKRVNRYAKQLMRLQPAGLKAGCVLALSAALSFTSHAQNYRTYVHADATNPIRRAGLPQGLLQPTFVDIDGDGDLDCYESNNGGSNLKITFLRNTGTKNAPYYETDTSTGFGELPNIPVTYSSDVDRLNFVDIDGDGDYDCYIGNYGGSYNITTLFYKNTGTATNPKFVYTPAESPLGGKQGRYGLQLSFADIDNDGDYDCAWTEQINTELLKNVGTAKQGAFQTKQTTYLSYLGRVSVYDYNKDGLIDFFVDYNGSPLYLRNTGTSKKPKFAESNYGPVFPSDFSRLYTFVDLDNDGIPEAYSTSGSYLVSAKAGNALAELVKPVITAYPNPFTNSFTLNLGKAYSTTTVIKISDVKNNTISVTKASNSVLQIGSNLKRGTYVVQVIQDNKLISSQKVIKE
jgi:type IX secretion system substrate protein/VCBS repeat protein